MRAGLLEWQAGLRCELESGGVVRMCFTSRAGLEENLAKAVQHVGLQNPIADLAEHGQCLMQVPCRMLVVPKTRVNLAEPDKALGFAACMPHRLEQVHRGLEVLLRVLVAAQPQVDNSEPGQRPGFALTISDLSE